VGESLGCVICEPGLARVGPAVVAARGFFQIPDLDLGMYNDFGPSSTVSRKRLHLFMSYHLHACSSGSTML
jgi:hypothetical protein